jgi:hypothetical protein
MNFKLRRIAAYLFAGIDWLFQAIATGCMAIADFAEDAKVRLRR